MGNAANAVGAVSTPRRAGPPDHRMQASAAKAGKFAIALPGDVDPLEGTDAPRYELANGATIGVSGGLRRPPAPAPVAPRPK